MKDRFLTLVIALMALLLSWMLLVPQSQSAREISLPTTEDRGEEGLKGLFEWLKKMRVPVTSLRNRYDTLLDSDKYAQTGNLLIISLPQRKNQRDKEWIQLANWLEKGNSVLILAAEFHTPSWSAGNRWKSKFNLLGKALGWSMHTDSVQQQNSNQQRPEKLADRLKGLVETLDEIKPESVKLVPDAKLPVMQGIEHLQGDYSSAVFRRNNYNFLSEGENLLTISLAQLVTSSEPTQPFKHKTVIYLLPAGQGDIYLSLMPDLFSTEELGQSDNARFINNLINNSLSLSGKVIFDDYHFGLSELYDKTQFFNDSRLHNTLLFIAAFWLVYVIGYTGRLAPVRQKILQVAEIDNVKAMSGFFAGRINQRSLATELVKHLILDIQLKYHLSNDEKVWLWLQQNPVLNHLDMACLSQVKSGMKVKPHELNININAIRKLIL